MGPSHGSRSEHRTAPEGRRPEDVLVRWRSRSSSRWGAMSSKEWEVEGTRNGPNSVSNYTSEKSAICFEFDDAGETRRAKIDPSGSDLDTRIREIDTNAREFTDQLPELPIPSSGDVTRDHCGDEMPVAFCDNPDHGVADSREKGHIFWGESRCRMARCPRCWESWDFAGAKPKVAKMEGLRRLRSSRGKDSKFHHVTVSAANINIRFDSDHPRERMTEAVKALMQTVNVATGYISYHPWRIAEEHRGDVLGHGSGDGDMNWKDIYPLVDERGWDAVVDELLVFAPHFHVVCLSEFVQGGDLTREIEARTGLVIERITAGDQSVSIFGLEALCGVMMYCLSHCGLYETAGGEFAAATPFGEVADFSAVPRVHDAVDEAMRSKAYDVLGVDFPARDDTCTEEIMMEAPETVSVRSQSAVSAATGTAPDETMGALWGSGGAGHDPSNSDEHPLPTDDSGTVVKETASVTTERTCLGRIRPMSTAPAVLDDQEWRAAAGEDAVEALSEAFELFIDLADERDDEQLDHPPPP